MFLGPSKNLGFCGGSSAKKLQICPKQITITETLQYNPINKYNIKPSPASEEHTAMTSAP
jgi:hypothetical protein